MASKKAGGSSKNGRDSRGKRLGVKKYGSQKVKPGQIVVRQRGTTFHSGHGTMLGRDYTLFAVIEGFVRFAKRKGGKTFVDIVPTIEECISCNHALAKLKTSQAQ